MNILLTGDLTKYIVTVNVEVDYGFIEIPISNSNQFSIIVPTGMCFVI